MNGVSEQDVKGVPPQLAAWNETEPVDDPITLFAPTNAAFADLTEISTVVTADGTLNPISSAIPPVILGVRSLCSWCLVTGCY